MEDLKFVLKVLGIYVLGVSVTTLFLLPIILLMGCLK
jgi:hypothetical protein